LKQETLLDVDDVTLFNESTDEYGAGVNEKDLPLFKKFNKKSSSSGKSTREVTDKLSSKKRELEKTAPVAKKRRDDTLGSVVIKPAAAEHESKSGGDVVETSSEPVKIEDSRDELGNKESSLVSSEGDKPVPLGVKDEPVPSELVDQRCNDGLKKLKLRRMGASGWSVTEHVGEQSAGAATESADVSSLGVWTKGVDLLRDVAAAASIEEMQMGVGVDAPGMNDESSGVVSDRVQPILQKSLTSLGKRKRLDSCGRQRRPKTEDVDADLSKTKCSVDKRKFGRSLDSLENDIDKVD